MAKTPKQTTENEIDPRGGDAILKRMLQAKPKTHDEMVAERHNAVATRPQKKPRGRSK